MVTRHREVTEALKAAHQQGLLEVFKATVTHLSESPTSNYGSAFRQPLVTMSIDKWKNLAGEDPGFGKIIMTDHDTLFVPGSRTQSGYRQVRRHDSYMKPTCKPHAFDYMATAYASHLPSELVCVVYANLPSVQIGQYLVPCRVPCRTLSRVVISNAISTYAKACLDSA